MMASGDADVPVRLQATDALDQVFDNPSEQDLWQMVSGLRAGANYFVLVRHLPDDSADGTYIQTAVLRDGRFAVEYQDGDVQHHFRAEVDTANGPTTSSWPGRRSARDGGRCWPGSRTRWDRRCRTSARYRRRSRPFYLAAALAGAVSTSWSSSA